MDITLLVTIKMSELKLGPFKHAQSMLKWPTGSVYIGNTICCLLYLPAPFPRGLEVDLEGSSTFPTLTLSMYIDKLGLFSHLYRCLFNYITMCQGIWAGASALRVEVGWHCTIAVSAWCSVRQLLGCECTVKKSCTPLRHLNICCIYEYIWPYAAIYTYIYVFIYKLQIYMCIIIHLSACLLVLLCSYIRMCLCLCFCVCVCACMCVCVCMCVYVCVCACACVCVYVCVWVCSSLHLVSSYFTGAYQPNLQLVYSKPAALLVCLYCGKLLCLLLLQCPDVYRLGFMGCRLSRGCRGRLPVCQHFYYSSEISMLIGLFMLHLHLYVGCWCDKVDPTIHLGLVIIYSLALTGHSLLECAGVWLSYIPALFMIAVLEFI